MKIFKNILQSNAGFSMVEILISTGILAMGVVATSTYFVKTSSQLSTAERRANVSDIYERLKSIASDPTAIVASSKIVGSNNSLLSSCVDPTKICPKAATSSLTQKRFILADMNGKVVAGNGLVGYDYDGELCTIGEPKCLWQPVTTFWATCPIQSQTITVPQDTCTRPRQLNFRIQLEPIEDMQPDTIRRAGKITTDGVRYRAFPDERSFNRSPKISFAISMRAQDTMEIVESTCRPDQAQKGVDDKGKAICECPAGVAKDNRGRVRKDGQGRPICETQQCSKTNPFEIMIGYDFESGKINCLDVRKCSGTGGIPKDCPCKTIDLSKNGDCGVGFWMVNVDYGECKAVTSKQGKGAGPDNVVCSRSRGRCCKINTK